VEGNVEDGVGADEGPAGVDAMESRGRLVVVLGVIHIVLTLERRHVEDDRCDET
jgi:hypothetical protein